VCEDILNELKRVGSYGVERYSVQIDYSTLVRIKLQEHLTFVDVLIKEGEKAITTLRFYDVPNPQKFNSKVFIKELSNLETLFNNKDKYGLSKNDYATSLIALSFTTFKATDRQPDVISYSFMMPKLIDVKHENGEFKITYRWDEYNRTDLTDAFFNAELEEKYKNKEKKTIPVSDITVEQANGKDADKWWYEHYNTKYNCCRCGKEIEVFKDGFVIDSEKNEPVCLECYLKSLQTK
jgi:hypothetical protein